METRKLVVPADVPAALGGGTLRLMRQRALVDFAVKWIEKNRK